MQKMEHVQSPVFLIPLRIHCHSADCCGSQSHQVVASHERSILVKTIAGGTPPCEFFKYSSRKCSTAVTSRLLRPQYTINTAGHKTSHSPSSPLTIGRWRVALLNLNVDCRFAEVPMGTSAAGFSLGPPITLKHAINIGANVRHWNISRHSIDFRWVELFPYAKFKINCLDQKDPLSICGSFQLPSFGVTHLNLVWVVFQLSSTFMWAESLSTSRYYHIIVITQFFRLLATHFYRPLVPMSGHQLGDLVDLLVAGHSL